MKGTRSATRRGGPWNDSPTFCRSAQRGPCRTVEALDIAKVRMSYNPATRDSRDWHLAHRHRERLTAA